jgi:hypothetical protein
MKTAVARRASSLVMLILLVATPRGFGSEEIEIDRRGIVDAVTGALEERYVYPEVAGQMAAHLRSKLDRGDYDEISSLNSFAIQLTMDLREVSEDGHIVLYQFDPKAASINLADEVSEQDIAKHARDNFGFVTAERLAGNIGYLKFDYFDFVEIAGPTATAAMIFVANCDAIIVDLRDNRGGKKDMVQFLASYFFRKPTHFLTVYDRKNEILEQTRSLAYVPGQRMFDTSVYILTSHRTGSAAEAFTYNLRSYDRATVVGETTKGIAHWVAPVDFPQHGLRIHVPYARPENLVTHTNWERVGVQPDIEAPADTALSVAHVEAMTMLVKKCSDKEESRILEWELVEVRAQAEPMEWTLEKMSAYTGVYGDGKYSIVIKDGRLCWRYSADEDHFLLPLNADVFVLADDDEIRFQIYRDEDGGVSAFQLKYSDGYEGTVWPRTGDLP